MSEMPSNKAKERFNKAMQALQSGNPEKAIQLFASVRKSWRDDADIGYLEGLAHGRIGDLSAVEKVSKRALKLVPDHFGALCNLANAQFANGNIEEAIENYNKALRSKPDAPEVMNNYGRALNMLGRRDEAVEFFKKAIARSPLHAPSHVALGRAYSDAGYPREARKEFIDALTIDPKLYEAHMGIAALYAGMGGLYDSEYHYNEALKLESHDVTVYLGLANVERHKGEYQKALNVLNKAELNIGNDDPQLLASRADILERKGDKDAAHDILNKLASEDNMTVLAVATFSRLCLHFDRCDEALELIVASSSLPSTTLTEQQSLMYAAGDLLDKLKRYDEAMEYYVKANSLLGIKCDRESYIKEVDEIIQCFNKDATLSFPRATTNSTRPVFVLGMPRSGTTLVEQILASHPDVYGAGELPYMKQAAISITGNTLVRDGDYARFMTNVDQDTMTRVADKYLQSLTNLNRDAKYVVDKMPHNFFNVGLIATLFPDARIIHCRRNPLDNALSIYFQSFLWAHDYAFDLSDIGFFYNQYDRLMQHWEDVLEIPIITVQYENLVNDQEKTSRMLLDFCGLEWDDAVLNFHNVSRDIATASYDQVRQPIYHSSKERWKNYKVHLEPLLTELNINISMTD